MLCKMFKYSLFICKCSERESHFDCHIDCHFDCNLQLIVNFLSDNMSELKGVRSGWRNIKQRTSRNATWQTSSRTLGALNSCNCYKQEDTDAIRDSLGHLTSLTGALKIHEIFIGEDLVVKKKMLPSDPFYKAVLIKESRKKSTGTNVLDDDNYDSD